MGDADRNGVRLAAGAGYGVSAFATEKKVLLTP
jgi:hypothetical protein